MRLNSDGVFAGREPGNFRDFASTEPEGSTVMIDAMGYQTEIDDTIVNEEGA